MGQVQGSQWENRIVLVLFVITTISFVMAGITGIAWRIMSLAESSFWLVIVTFTLIISAVTVLTYSFLSFTQNRTIDECQYHSMGIPLLTFTSFRG